MIIDQTPSSDQATWCDAYINFMWLKNFVKKIQTIYYDKVAEKLLNELPAVFILF